MLKGAFIDRTRDKENSKRSFTFNLQILRLRRASDTEEEELTALS